MMKILLDRVVLRDFAFGNFGTAKRRFALGEGVGFEWDSSIISRDLHTHSIYGDIILVGGLEHEFYEFPFRWECHHPM
jgi:hypothetical protein